MEQQEIKQKRRSWSYSTLKLFEQCAFKYKCTKIDKMPDPPSYAVLKGFAAHEDAEKYLKGEGHLTNPLANFAKEFKNLKAAGAIPERPMVLDDRWIEIQGPSNDEIWAHEDAWLRLKMDAQIDNMIIDFKTGKQYDDHAHQARLYANAVMINNADYDEINVEFWYLNSGAVTDYTFYRKDLADQILAWNTKIEKLMTATEFPATKNQYCKYCAFKNICPAFK